MRSTMWRRRASAACCAIGLLGSGRLAFGQGRIPPGVLAAPETRPAADALPHTGPDPWGGVAAPVGVSVVECELTLPCEDARELEAELARCEASRVAEPEAESHDPSPCPGITAEGVLFGVTSTLGLALLFAISLLLL